MGTGRATADNERIVKADVRGKKKRERTVGEKKEGRKLVFLRSSTSRGAFCVAIIKAEVTPSPSPFPPLSLSRLDDVVVFLSKTDHRTEKAERARNFTQCQEIKVSLYIRLYSFSIPHVLPPSPLLLVSVAPLIRPHVRSDKVDVTRWKEKDIPSDETFERGAYIKTS